MRVGGGSCRQLRGLLDARASCPAGPAGLTGPAVLAGPAGPAALAGLAGPAGPAGLADPGGAAGPAGATGLADATDATVKAVAPLDIKASNGTIHSIDGVLLTEAD